jgi:hypothetical protein
LAAWLVVLLTLHFVHFIIYYLLADRFAAGPRAALPFSAALISLLIH